MKDRLCTTSRRGLTGGAGGRAGLGSGGGGGGDGGGKEGLLAPRGGGGGDAGPVGGGSGAGGGGGEGSGIRGGDGGSGTGLCGGKGGVLHCISQAFCWHVSRLPNRIDAKTSIGSEWGVAFVSYPPQKKKSCDRPKPPMEARLASFCALATKLKADAAASKPERDDARRAKLATKEMLLASMERHRVSAVRVPGEEELFARVRHTAVRYVPMRDERDVLPLFDGMAEHLRGSEGDAAQATHALFLQRARRGGGERSVAIVKRLPTTERAVQEGEAPRLAACFAASCAHTRELSQRAKPLRDAVRAATKELAPAVASLETPPRVVARDRAGAEKAVLTVALAPPPKAKAAAALGARRVGQLVKAAALVAERATEAGDLQGFERAFKEHLRAMLRAAVEERKRAGAEPAPRLVIKREAL